MKKLMILFIVFCFGLTSCKPQYEVIRMDDYPKSELYYIYVRKNNNDSIYQLVTVKQHDSIKNYKRKIKVGQKYRLDLVKKVSFKGEDINDNFFEKDIFVEGVPVNQNYRCNNIFGIYIIE